MMRFTRRDLQGDRNRAWCILVLGILLFLTGPVGITLMLTGHTVDTFSFYLLSYLFAIGGIALIGTGWTNLREIRALELERLLRKHRAVAGPGKSG